MCFILNVKIKDSLAEVKNLPAKIKEWFKNVPDNYRAFPEPVRNRFVVYFLGTLGLFAASIAIGIVTKDITAFAPFAVFAIIGICLCCNLLTISKSIVKLEGNCTEIMLNPIKTAARKVFFYSGDKKICISVKEKYKKLQKGDYIVVYVSPKAHIFTEDGVINITDYIALTITSVYSDSSEKKNKIFSK